MCSLDARSGRPIQASLLERIRASVDGQSVIPVIQKVQRGLRVVLGTEDDIETGLCECEAKQLALAGAVFDQENEGCGTIYKGTSAGNKTGLKMNNATTEYLCETVSYDHKLKVTSDGR
jgi:hypothetical protein